MGAPAKDNVYRESVGIKVGSIVLEGDISIPKGAKDIVIFAHGSGSGRFSPRNRFVAEKLNQKGIGTLLFDLLTEEEEQIDMRTGELRFNIELLAKRLVATTDWVANDERTAKLRIGYFGASTGAAAALIAAAERPKVVKAVVSRGGRPDMAAQVLEEVKCPTLLIVGGLDDIVIELNREAFSHIKSERKMIIVEGATHLFEEHGKLEEVADYASDWFLKHL
jgi:putative phosphoribosyl transferase